MELKVAISTSQWLSTKLSIVIVTCNEGENLRQTVNNLLATLPASGEIIVVDDFSTDGSTDFLTSGYARVKILRPKEKLGVARARDFGSHYAEGELIVFSDAHVQVSLGWWPPIIKELGKPNVGAVAPAISVLGNSERKGYGMTVTGPNLGAVWLGMKSPLPYTVPMLGGGFIAMRRDAFEDVGGFDDGMLGWGSEDLELSLRLWLLGYEVVVVPEVEVAHLFRDRPPYDLEWMLVTHNMLRLAFAHFNPDRLTRVIEAIKGYPAFAKAMAITSQSDIWTRRAKLFERRVNDDDWYFDSFGITC